MSALRLVWITFALATLSGCASTTDRGFAGLRLDNAPAATAFQAARQLIEREFGRVTVERDALRMLSSPVEYATAADSGAASDLYGGRSRMRRIATCVVAPRGEGSSVQVRVEIEREDTVRREAIMSETPRMGDMPSVSTAITRDAATSARQNTDWTFVRRDLRMERQLLADLRERFAPPPAAQPAQDAEPAPDASKKP